MADDPRDPLDAGKRPQDEGEDDGDWVEQERPDNGDPLPTVPPAD